MAKVIEKTGVVGAVIELGMHDTRRMLDVLSKVPQDSYSDYAEREFIDSLIAQLLRIRDSFKY